MNWHFCIDSTEKRALDLCRGSMNKGDGSSWGSCYGSGWGSGYGDGYGWGDGDGYGWGDSYGSDDGDGSSPQEWR